LRRRGTLNRYHKKTELCPAPDKEKENREREKDLAGRNWDETKWEFKYDPNVSSDSALISFGEELIECLFSRLILLSSVKNWFQLLFVITQSLEARHTLKKYVARSLGLDLPSFCLRSEERSVSYSHKPRDPLKVSPDTPTRKRLSKGGK